MVDSLSNVDYRYNMIQDYQHTTWPPVASNIDNAFLTLQNSTDGVLKNELLTVSEGNNLMHFFEDSESNSGWNHEERAVDEEQGKPVNKLLGFYQQQTLFVLAHYSISGANDKVIGMQKTPSRGWGAMPISNNLANALGNMSETDTFTDIDGNVFIYGISGEFTTPTFVIVGAQKKSKHWNIVFETPATPDTSYRLLPGSDNQQITVMSISNGDATFRAGSVIDDQFTWGPTAAITHNLGQGSISAQQVYPYPASCGALGFLLLSSEKVLFQVSHYMTAAIEVSAMVGQKNQPLTCQQLSVGVDSENRWMIFAMDADLQLWLLRQTQTKSQTVDIPSFEDWVPLGNNLNNIACPKAMLNGPELFFYDLSAKVNHMHQDIANQGSTWFTTQIASPTAIDLTPVETTTYTQEFVVKDSNEMIIPNAAVAINTDRVTVLVINGISYQAYPGQAINVQANERGIVTIATNSTTLSAAQLSCAVINNKEATATAWCRADVRVHQRLAGKDVTFPISGSILQQQGLLPQKMSSADAEQATKNITVLAGAAYAKQQPSPDQVDQPKLDNVAWLMDFSKQDEIVFQELSTADFDVQFLQNPTLSVDSFLSHLVGDVTHFFSHELDKIDSIAVSIVDGAVHFCINGVSCLLNTINDIASAIELLFKKIFAALKEVVEIIEKLIEWLRMLLDFENYIRTARAFSHLFTAGMDNLNTNLNSQLSSVVQTQFASVKSELVDFVTNIESNIPNDMTFGNLISGATSKQESTSPTPANQTAQWQSDYNNNAVRCNYVRTKSESYLNQYLQLNSNIALANAEAIDLSTFFDAFEHSFEPDKLSQALEKVVTLFENNKTSEDFYNLSVQEVLLTLQDVMLLVIDGIEAVLLELIELAGGAPKAFGDMLSKNIDIPIISWVYKKITGEDLNILNLYCLILATPVTILYEIKQGSPPFPSSSSLDQVLNTPFNWSLVESDNNDEQQNLADFSDVLTWINGLTWVLYAGEDSYADAGITDSEIRALSAPGYAVVITETITQVLGGPWSLLSNSNRTNTEDWIVAAWGAAWVPVASDALFEVANKTLTRYVDIDTITTLIGPFISCVWGGGLLVTNSIAVAKMEKSDEEYNKATMASMLLPVFPLLIKPAALFPVEGANTAFTVDTLGDMGTGAALIASIYSDSLSNKSMN